MSESVDSPSTVGGRRPPAWLRLIPLALPLAVLIAIGLRGLDFGVHWDERYFQIAPVKRMVETGILPPNYYGYPSFVYWVNLGEVARVWDGDRRAIMVGVAVADGSPPIDVATRLARLAVGRLRQS